MRSYLRSRFHQFAQSSERVSQGPGRAIRTSVIAGLAVCLCATVTAHDAASTPTLGPKFSEVLASSQAIQSQNSEKTAIVWEVDGHAFCGHTPPPAITNGFQFSDSSRWSTSATNQQPLNQGDPMTLTWSFIPDGPQGIGFTCGVTGEVDGADSNLIAFLDGLYGVGPGGSDLTQRPWFSIFEAAFDNWGSLNGINYVYEPMDDGATAGAFGLPGVLGQRGDLRIGGHLIDGQIGSNVLACNYFASNGDMIIDTGNSNFYAPNFPENRGFRNVLEHEHGHGLSIRHVCPLNQTKLMEPFIATNFIGPQEDDILAANRGYGDRDEFPTQNDSANNATSLGAIAIDGSASRTQVSIDGSSDQDFYSFDAPANSQVSITLTPTGSTYLDGPQSSNGSCSAGTPFNALIENNLGIELRNQSGTNLASANSNSAGVQERITNAPLNQGAGTYFVRVFGSQNRAQMYNLSVELSEKGTVAPGDNDCNNFVTKTSNGEVVTFCL